MSTGSNDNKSPGRKTVKKKSPAKKATKNTAKTAAAKKTATGKRRISVKEKPGIADTASPETMTPETKTGENNNTGYRLDPVLTINGASTLKQELTRLASLEADVSIDASAVEMTDTASLQVLLAFVHQIEAQDRSIHWIEPSERLLANASLLGLKDALQL